MPSDDRLTARERQILDLAAQHLTSKQIGPLLGIRPASVDTFMQAIIKKLGVAGRKEAVIAYLATLRDQGRTGRDDLDFGSSPVFDEGGAPSGGEVIRNGDQGDPPRRTRLRTWRAIRSSLNSPSRRLVAIAIAAMVLGLVTLGAVVVGYGLIQTFDRMFADHGQQHPAAPAANRVPTMQNLSGARVAKQLFSAEDAIDRTLGETAKLITTMCEARIANRLPAIAGQRAIGGAAEALAALERARRNVLDTHEGLAFLREEYGFETVGAGALHKPEVVEPTGALEAAA